MYFTCSKNYPHSESDRTWPDSGLSVLRVTFRWNNGRQLNQSVESPEFQMTHRVHFSVNSKASKNENMPPLISSPLISSVANRWNNSSSRWVSQRCFPSNETSPKYHHRKRRNKRDNKDQIGTPLGSLFPSRNVPPRRLSLKGIIVTVIPLSANVSTRSRSSFLFAPPFRNWKAAIFAPVRLPGRRRVKSGWVDCGTIVRVWQWLWWDSYWSLCFSFFGWFRCGKLNHPSVD